MHRTHVITITLLALAAGLCAEQAFAGGRGTLVREAVEAIAGRGGRELTTTPATRKAIAEVCGKEGPILIQRVPPKLVVAAGLATAAVYGTHRGTAPLAALGRQIGNDPTLAQRLLDWLGFIAGAIVLTVTTSLLWRAGLFQRATGK